MRTLDHRLGLRTCSACRRSGTRPACRPNGELTGAGRRRHSLWDRRTYSGRLGVRRLPGLHATLLTRRHARPCPHRGRVTRSGGATGQTGDRSTSWRSDQITMADLKAIGCLRRPGVAWTYPSGRPSRSGGVHGSLACWNVWASAVLRDCPLRLPLLGWLVPARGKPLSGVGGRLVDELLQPHPIEVRLADEVQQDVDLGVQCG